MWKRRTHAGESRIKEPVGYMRQQQHIYFFTIFSHSRSYIFASECCSPIFISFPSFISPISFNCLSLTVPSSRFPHQIFCSRTTAAPFLQSSPLIHTTDILAHCLVSVNVHSKVSKSGPFQQRVPGRFSQAMRPAVEHAFLLYRVYRADRTSSTPPL